MFEFQTSVSKWYVGRENTKTSDELVRNSIMTSFMGMARHATQGMTLKKGDYELSVGQDMLKQSRLYFTLKNTKTGREEGRFMFDKDTEIVYNFYQTRQVQLSGKATVGLGSGIERIYATTNFTTELSAALTKATQVMLGVKPDGKYGKETFKAYDDVIREDLKKGDLKWLVMPRDKYAWESVAFAMNPGISGVKKNKVPETATFYLSEFGKAIGVQIDNVGVITHPDKKMSLMFNVNGKMVKGEQANHIWLIAVETMPAHLGVHIDGLMGKETIAAAQKARGKVFANMAAKEKAMFSSVIGDVAGFGAFM